VGGVSVDDGSDRFHEGFDRDHVDRLTVTVGPEPDSLARGVSALAGAHQTIGPARSHPTHRRRPPVIELGEEHLPERLPRREPATSLELRLPPSVAAIFVTAPLAYYCCASVRTSDVSRPVLVDEDAGYRQELAGLPGLERDAASLLRRAFFLDCLVRDMEGSGSAPVSVTVGPGTASTTTRAADLDLDAESLQAASPGERLRRYRTVPDDRLDDLTPDWHLASYVEPRPDYVHCLGRLLASLSLVYLPRATRCEPSDLLSHTLDDALATRGNSEPSARLKPVTDGSHVHAWLAPGTPIGAFKATPRAYRHRRTLESRRQCSTGRVNLVLADPEMAEEAETAVTAYETAPAVDTLDTSTVATRADLREALAAPADLVHYIGHCDEEGLRCRDGWLDADALDHIASPAFILNACDSYEQGLSLLDAGSVGGVVTVCDVLDDHAATVGSSLARLLLRGFELSRATHLARRRILMGADYVVVGDGTYRVYEPSTEPTVLRVEGDGDRFQLRSRGVATDRTGHAVDGPLPVPPTLNGDEAAGVCDREELLELLRTVSLPVIYADELWWSPRLAEELSTLDPFS
jgi:hypothetical protein